MTDPDQIVRDLHDLLAEDGDLATLLEESLSQAQQRAEAELDPTLFEALGWPTNMEEYDDYLRGFLRWIPQQTDHPAWKTSSPEERYAQEVNDRLSHFYWLVDQQVGGERKAAEASGAFRDWLSEFARQWGSYLDTPDSFDDEILRSFQENAPEYHVEESMVAGRPNAPSGWLTFNQFFARELNPGLRPISDPTDNRTITSPADCSYEQTYGIDDESNIPATRIKQSHRYGNIQQLLEGSAYADAFAGGTFVHYMLPPSAYHRYHVPVSGEVKESFVVTGQAYMQVELEDHLLTSKDSSETGYEFFQTRGVLTLDTAASGDGDLGMVAVVPVGMSHVASVNLTAVEDRPLAKGQEFGYFLFGGSDIIVCFQRGVDVDIDTSDGSHLVGSPIARVRQRS